MLIEDDPVDVRLLQIAFDSVGLKEAFFRLRDGAEGRAYLDGDGAYADRSQNPLPRVVLLDLKLPRVTGMELLEWVRSRGDSRREIPVVMFSSSTEHTDIERAYQLGVNSYVAKPSSTHDRRQFADAFANFWVKFNEIPAERARNRVAAIEVVAPQHWRSFTVVQISGMYETFMHERRIEQVLVKGESFPACECCGSRLIFRLLKAAPHITEDADFAP